MKRKRDEYKFDVKVFGQDWNIIERRKMGCKKSNWKEFLTKFGIDWVADENPKKRRKR